MARAKPQTGRARRGRIELKCHTGIRPFREFLTFFSGIRQPLRQEYLRRCLVTGLRSGSFFESGLPEKDSGGNVRKIRVEITDGDPDLTAFLRQYDDRGEWEGRTLWVLKILLGGFAILSGSEGAGPLPALAAAEENPAGGPAESSQNLMKGLFT